MDSTELTRLLGLFFRKWLQCKPFDKHCNVTHHDDMGIAGAWTCNDCGHHQPAIEWPKYHHIGPPPMPKVKPISKPCEHFGK